MRPDIQLLRFRSDYGEQLPQPSVFPTDHGYDGDSIRTPTEAQNTLSVIPMRKSHKKRIGEDRELCRLRKLVERCCNKHKNAKRVLTRYDNSAGSFFGFIGLTSIRLWLHQFTKI
ncbi:hypothetical protein [Limimaricola sp. G21655-S1]|uniref:hypothetical protein n=1 Tax=Limimaricola sp. G21655-S1 TaxID=3014768 RepID=UPI00359C60EF